MMKIEVRAYRQEDLGEMIAIWNEVVEDGVAFPQEELLNEETGRHFFAEQTCSAVAEDVDTGRICGLYILHPNNVGRCAHICNASFAVRSESRGLHIGKKLVADCLVQGKGTAFRSCSSMPWWPVILMPGICMSGWDSCSWERFPEGSG